MNELICADALTYLEHIPDNSFDVIFIDPPYGIKATTKSDNLYRPEGEKYTGVTSYWDDELKLKSERNDFIEWYVMQCKRLCKKDGTVWIMGNHVNIHTVGHTMLQNNYYILSDVIWIKSNPTPNFLGKRFTNATEQLIWAMPYGKGKHYFDYQAMKAYNNGKQMRTDWHIPICSGKERLKIMKDGNLVKAHETQKPIELLKRVVLSSLKEDGTILDFFAGTGTTGVAAAFYNRQFTLIERDKQYCELIKHRLDILGIEYEYAVY